MKRLTAISDVGEAYYPYCYRADTCDGEGETEKCRDCEFSQQICKTLAAYENTGLTPEEIMYMQELEKILDKIEAEHPYKVSGDHGTYGQYNEGWSDAIDRMRGELENVTDGWIPVGRELPPNAKHKGAFCPKVRVMTKFGETYGWYNPDCESWYILVWFMTERYLDSEIDFEGGDKPKIVRLPDEVNDTKHILVAWQPLPEPYRPERSDE